MNEWSPIHDLFGFFLERNPEEIPVSEIPVPEIPVFLIEEEEEEEEEEGRRRRTEREQV
jgi:hypothetical protein